MSDVTFNSVQVEHVFLARPLPATAMIAIFIGVVLLSVYLYRRPR